MRLGSGAFRLQNLILGHAARYAHADSDVDPLEYTAFLTPRDNVPNSKILINMLSDGTYRGELGSIANPVEGDLSTGRLDRTVHTELLRLDPGIF